MLYHIKYFLISVIDFSIYVLEYFHYLIDPISYEEKEHSNYISFTDDDSLPPLIDMTNDDILYDYVQDEEEEYVSDNLSEYEEEKRIYDKEKRIYEEEKRIYEDDDEEYEEYKEYEKDAEITCDYFREEEFEPKRLFDFDNHEEAFFLKKSFIDKLIEIKNNNENQEYQKDQQLEHQKDQQLEHQKDQEPEHQKDQPLEHQKDQEPEHQEDQEPEHQKDQEPEHQEPEQYDVDVEMYKKVFPYNIFF